MYFLRNIKPNLQIYKVCPESNVSKSNKNHLFNLSLQMFKNFQNSLLLRRYIGYSKTSSPQMHCCCPCTKCPLMLRCKVF